MTHRCPSTPLPPWQQLPPCLSWGPVGIFVPTCSEDPAPVPTRKLVLSFLSSEQNLLCILLRTFMPILGCFPLSAFDAPSSQPHLLGHCPALKEVVAALPANDHSSWFLWSPP